jgi:hypothetical protein
MVQDDADQFVAAPEGLGPDGVPLVDAGGIKAIPADRFLLSCLPVTIRGASAEWARVVAILSA